MNEYIQQIKIEEAKHMIQFTSTPLSEIGSLLNFTDQSYFTKIFKNIPAEPQSSINKRII